MEGFWESNMSKSKDETETFEVEIPVTVPVTISICIRGITVQSKQEALEYIKRIPEVRLRGMLAAQIKNDLECGDKEQLTNIAINYLEESLESVENKKEVIGEATLEDVYEMSKNTLEETIEVEKRSDEEDSE